jgi:hypothetical protein
MPDQSNRSLGCSSLSGKTSSVKRSKSCLMLTLSGKSTTRGGWPTLLSSPRSVGSFRCASTTPVSARHAPKHPFPLPQIDQIVDSTSGCDLLCLLDSYSSLHQIPMSREDEEHTTFIIVHGLFCYVFMSYGLKNALPTFVRAMHKTFGDLIMH